MGTAMRKQLPSVETVTFLGKVFRRYPNSSRLADRTYFKLSRTPPLPNISLHRAVWEYYKGPIPLDHHVHHKYPNDFHTIDVDRLECIPKFDQISQHKKQWIAEHPDQWRKHNTTISPLAAAWHRSREGRAWHRNHVHESIHK